MSMVVLSCIVMVVLSSCSSASDSTAAFDAQNSCERALDQQLGGVAHDLTFTGEHRAALAGGYTITGAASWRTAIGDLHQREWSCAAHRDGSTWTTTVTFNG